MPSWAAILGDEAARDRGASRVPRPNARRIAGLAPPRAALGRSGLALEVELLPGDRGLVHHAALGDGEDRHALLVAAFDVGGGAADALAGGGAAGAGLRRRAGRDRDRARLGAEFELAFGEVVERALVLEEDDLAEQLAAQLGAHRQLRHRGVADVLAALVDATGA